MAKIKKFGEGLKKEIFTIVKINKKDIPVKFTGEITAIGNDGIGGYEFWGAKCFDAGNNYVEEFLIHDLIHQDGSPIEAELKQHIEKALYEDEKYYEPIGESLMEVVDDARYKQELEYEKSQNKSLPEESIFD